MIMIISVSNTLFSLGLLSIILTYLLNNTKITIYPKNKKINIKIKLIKSCKKINSSIIGELASCRPNWPQFIIISIFKVYSL